MQNILIAATGLTGLIGSRLEELLSRDFEWRALRYEDGVDITDREKVDRAIGDFNGDTVLHLAAFTDLNAANKELAKAGLKLAITSLAKREEEIYLPNEAIPIKLPKFSPALQLLHRGADDTSLIWLFD